MDFVQQIGADAYMSVNVGSGTSKEAADWFEYLTTNQPTASAKERAANGHPEPVGSSYLGIGEEVRQAAQGNAARMGELIRTHGAIMDKYDPEKRIALVVDGWGGWLAPTPGSKEGFLEQQNSQRDAIIAALNINTFARHADCVRMANIAQMVKVLQPCSSPTKRSS